MNDNITHCKSWSRVIVLCVFIAILSTTPYVFKQFLPLPSEKIVIILFLLLFICIVFLKRKFFVLPKEFNICVLIQFFCWFLYAFIHSDTSYVTRIMYLALTYIIILLLSSSVGVKEFIRKNNLWVSIQAILGLFAFLLILVGVLPSLFSFQNVDERTAFCYGLTCTNAVFGSFIRAAGYFDEPGTLAFWGVYALVLNKLYIKDKKIELMLILGLLSTFSTAYYIQVIFYFLFFKFKFNFKSLIFILFIGVIFLFVYNQGEDNSLYKLIYGRVELNEYGELETNRTSLTQKAKDLYLLNPVWGNGAEKISKRGEYIADNPYETLAVDGLIGTIVIYLPLLILIIKNWRCLDVVGGVIIIALGYLQRPFHIVLLHYIMLYSFLYLGINKKNKFFLSTKNSKIKN